MKFIITLVQVAVIYFFSILGEWIHDGFNISIPGSIIGLILLFLLLITKIIPEKWIEFGANFYLTYMALFFIPATVGVMNYFDLFHGQGLWIVAGAILSTCIVMVCAGLVSEKLGEQVFKKEKKAA